VKVEEFGIKRRKFSRESDKKKGVSLCYKKTTKE
jgi:hypothetical protein